MITHENTQPAAQANSGHAARPPQTTSVGDGEFSMDRPLLWLSPDDPWTVRDSCEGTQIFGQTGSGKSSGSGRSIAKAFLTAGYGGLVLTAKPGDRAEWEQYAAETGRSDSVIVFSFEEPWRFNFLDYEARVHHQQGLTMTKNLVDIFVNLSEAVGRSEGKGGGDDQKFWMDQNRRLLTNAIDVLYAARGKITLPDLCELIRTAPITLDQIGKPKWQSSSLCFRCIDEGDRRLSDMPEAQRSDFEDAARFFLDDWPQLAEKTRSVIKATFDSLADLFVRGPMGPLFNTTTNIVPELAHEGAILIIDIPVRKYNEVGQAAQLVWKSLWQRSIERRTVTDTTRPCFLWCDESQLFLTSSDQSFMTTARSSRASVVFLTQNISNYYSVLGESSKPVADSLVGNLATKIFHANGDAATNQWASDLFSKEWQQRMTTSEGTNKNAALPMYMPGGETQSTSFSESLEYEVQPADFHRLRTGGPANDLSVDGIVFKSGRQWAQTGKTSLRCTFPQDA